MLVILARARNLVLAAAYAQVRQPAAVQTGHRLRLVGWCRACDLRGQSYQFMNRTIETGFDQQLARGRWRPASRWARWTH